MILVELRDESFPAGSIKTMQNRAARGALPKRTGDVYYKLSRRLRSRHP